MKTYVGVVFVLLAAFCWGIVGVLARFLLQAGIAPLEITFWRMVFGCILFGSAAVITKRAGLRARKDIFLFVGFGVVCLAGLFLCYMAAVDAGGAALVAVLQYTAPAWIAILSRMLFGEQLTKAKCLAILVTLTGIALVSFSGESGTVNITGLSVGLGLLTSLLFSLQCLSTKKLVAGYSSFTIFAYGFFFAALALFPFVEFVEKSAADWLVLLALGVGCTFLAFLFFAAGVKRIEISTASIISTIESVVAVVAAWLVWDETFSPLGVLGVVLVIGAVLIFVVNTAPDKNAELQFPAGEI